MAPTAISAAVPRLRSTLAGRVTEVQANSRPWLRFDVEITDGTGSITLRFIGRDAVPGMRPGRCVRVQGTPAEEQGRLIMLNPLYEFTSEGSEIHECARVPMD